jgi:uncharacterized membrane protein YgcG
MYWVRDQNVRLSSLQPFSVKFTGVTPTEYTAATVASLPLIYMIIALVVICICIALSVCAKKAVRKEGGGFIFFGGGNYGGNNGGGSGSGGGGYGGGGGGY